MVLKFDRYFTKKGEDVYDKFDWEKGDVDITDEDGSISFTQRNVEFPCSWSSLARKIVASRYFFGEKDTKEREGSVRQLVGRVSETFSEWAMKENYFSTPQEAEAFRDEIAYLSVDQRAAFNRGGY